MPQVALDSGTTPAADTCAPTMQTSEINTPYGPFIILPGKSQLLSSSPSLDERHSAPTADFCFSSYRHARIPQHRFGNNTKSYVPPP
ncbi:hypothetical protein ARSEF1564_004057 [Beauveria bassiana]